MHKLMYLVRAIASLSLLGATAFPSQAAIVLVDPIEPVMLGETVTVAIRVEGIDESSQIGSFSLELLYPDSLLAYPGADFGDPDPFNIPAIAVQGVQPIAGGILVEKHFGGMVGDLTFPPSPQQDPSFTLVTLTFDTLQAGTQGIGLVTAAFYSPAGDALAFDTLSFSSTDVTVNDPLPSVPEPSTLALLFAGIAGLNLLLHRSRGVSAA
jgi:hypothetical protein